MQTVFDSSKFHNRQGGSLYGKPLQRIKLSRDQSKVMIKSSKSGKAEEAALKDGAKNKCC